MSEVIDAQVIDTNDYVFGEQDFASNVDRVPIIIALDISYSMKNKPILQLSTAAANFLEEVKNISDTSKYMDICFITYNDEIVHDGEFASVRECKVPNLVASGGTNTSKAIRLALDKAENIKSYYKKEGYGYKQPWIVHISDGYGGEVEEVAKEVRTLQENDKLTFFSIGIGSSAPLTDMKKFGHVFKLEDTNHISKAFEWLSQSLAVIGNSRTGQKVNIPAPEQLYLQVIA
jgi:uncharacterized protein YegL